MNPASAAHADSPESTGSADRKWCPATPRAERNDGDEEPRPGVEMTAPPGTPNAYAVGANHCSSPKQKPPAFAEGLYRIVLEILGVLSGLSTAFAQVQLKVDDYAGRLDWEGGT